MEPFRWLRWITIAAVLLLASTDLYPARLYRLR